MIRLDKLLAALAICKASVEAASISNHHRYDHHLSHMVTNLNVTSSLIEPATTQGKTSALDCVHVMKGMWSSEVVEPQKPSFNIKYGTDTSTIPHHVSKRETLNSSMVALIVMVTVIFVRFMLWCCWMHIRARRWW